MTEKKFFIITFLMTTPAIYAQAVDNTTYETCTNCETCGNFCKYTLIDGKLTVYGPLQEDASGKIPSGSLAGQFPRDTAISEVDIKGNITAINSLFSGVPGLGNDSIKKISIPDTVTTIGTQAFYAFRGIEGTLEIPNSVTSIGSEAFYRMTNIDTLVLGDSLASTGFYGIGGMGPGETGLKNLVIGDSLTTLTRFNLLSNGRIYCQNTTENPNRCANLINANNGGYIDNLVTYTKDANGVYISGDLNYASAEDMANQRTCGTQAQCEEQIQQNKKKEAVSMINSGFCQTKAGCLKLMELTSDKTHCSSIATCRTYAKTSGMVFDIFESDDGSYALYDANGRFLGYKGKRIYTIDEANAVAGEKNRVSIKYK